MAKSRKISIIKTIDRTASKTLPVVDKSLKTVGIAAKDVAEASIPIVEKGVSAVYGTMATGLDLGVEGVKSVSKRLKSRKISRSLARSRKLAGGSRRKRTLAGSRRTRRSRKH